jgi:hypothetical protein
MPKNPAKNPRPIDCGSSSATAKATTAMLHQGKNKPAIKLINAMSNVTKINRIRPL